MTTLTCPIKPNGVSHGSRFKPNGVSHGSQSQPWLTPKRLNHPEKILHGIGMRGARDGLLCLAIIFLSSFFAPIGWSQTEDEQAQEDRAGTLAEMPATANLHDSLEAMMLTSQAFRAAVEKIKPCLVTIESFGGVKTVKGRIGGIRRQGDGPTTGVMLTPDGYILTSTFNFIQNQPLISVIPSDGIRRTARMVGRDDIRKICLLKIDNVQGMPTPEIAKLDEMQVGQWTLSVGIGYGDIEPAIARGILSAKNRIGGRAIQTDSNTSPANYGGPLIDIHGRLMGICVPLNPQSQAIGAGVEWYDSGIGFAIPLDGNEKLIERLKRGERIAPAFLGVLTAPNEQGTGVWIQQVVKDSPAEKAGLLPHDVIVGIGDVEVADLMGLRQVLNRKESGNQIVLKVLKNGEGEPVEVPVILMAPPQPRDEFETLDPPEIR